MILSLNSPMTKSTMLEAFSTRMLALRGDSSSRLLLLKSGSTHVGPGWVGTVATLSISESSLDLVHASFVMSTIIETTLLASSIMLERRESQSTSTSTA